MLMIRFVRVGRKNQAYFHLVVAEKARAVQKKIVEKLGYLNPHTEKGAGEFVFDADRIKHFIKNGAQMSQTAARLLVKNGVKEAGVFIEERKSKPKKEPKPVEEAPKEESPAEESAETETPAEESTPDKEEKNEETPKEGVKEEAPVEEEKKEEAVEEKPEETSKEEEGTEEKKEEKAE